MHGSMQHSLRITRVAAIAILGGVSFAGPASAQIVDRTAVTAEVIPLQAVVALGQPVWVEFRLHNPTDHVAVLMLEGTTAPDLNPPAMGLPVAHVIGHRGDALVEVVGVDGKPRTFRTTGDGADTVLRIAPSASVGIRIDLAEHCPGLAHPGRFTVSWRPYGGAAIQAEIVVVALKRVRVTTDLGDLLFDLYYNDAPKHVQNFIELCEAQFYNGLSFHRIEPAFLIQGGSPGGSPTGVHPSGRKLEPEFNDRPFKRGTVGMARRPSDPASASCQFFVCATRWPELDGQYTAFGELVGAESLETLNRLMKLDVDGKGRPRRPVGIRRAVTEEALPASADGSSAMP